ncbi:MAG: Histidine-tRNA ligase [Parcubacteria group bacterium GW2011_GWC2_39_14]|nr:MAG: Histidine-tRNA ligase [Parcubacteria group bacterium GW2011_GWC2_39_14]KKR54924.1 MAG: Histidine-tRNA ligase [Parcubacteria group bacterium GW2011_GWA2_40_23]
MPRRKKEDQPQEDIRSIKTPPLIMGMKDVLPTDARYWEFVERTVVKLIDDYSFKRIETPVIEKYELFNHTLFKQSGLAEKEVFSFIDRGEKLALRPEATTSIARAFVSHNMVNQTMPMKVYYWGPMFRQNRVEENTFRQFTQVGFEIIGDATAAIDAELIILGHYLLKNLMLESEIHLNSLGCAVCRPEYKKTLSGFLKSKRSAVCADCRKSAGRDPMHFFSCTNPKCLKLREEMPQTIDWLCDECRSHLFKVLEYLDELKIPYRLDPFLLRTFDYYSKTVFEITTKTDEENTTPVVLAGGGRYDYLIEMVGGVRTPAAGFAFGLERIVNQMKNSKIEVPAGPAPDVFVTQLSEQARQKAFAIYEKIRHEDFTVRANFSKSSLKAQLELAKKANAKLVLIFGQKEIVEGTVLLRDLESGIQEVINQNRIVVEVKKRLKEKKD